MDRILSKNVMYLMFMYLGMFYINKIRSNNTLYEASIRNSLIKKYSNKISLIISIN